MHLNMRTWLLVAVLVAPNFAIGQPDGINPNLILDHLYETGPASRWQNLNPSADQTSETLSQQAAAVLAGDVLERLTLETDISATERGRSLSNAGVFQTYAGNLSAGRATLDQALETLMIDRHQFDPEIATVVTAIGVNAFLQEDFESAENQFRWSQHIQHRQDGLFSANQAKNLNWLTRVYLAELDFNAADTAQRYILRIARNTYREGSPELTKVRDGIAKYLAQRGKMISPLSDELQRALRQTLFADAITLLNENLRAIEAEFGPEALALVSILETKAEIYFWRGSHSRQQERALERALSILELQPNQSAERLAAAWFNLADGYVLTGNRKATEAYAAGWSLQNASQKTDREKIPQSTQAPVLAFTQNPDSALGTTTAPTLAAVASESQAGPLPSAPPSAITASEKISSTVKTDAKPSNPVLLWPEALGALSFEPVNEEKYPPAVDYYVDFSFTISAMGKPKRIAIASRNVPSEEARWARSAIHNSRYRPALLNGTAVPFETQFRQSFVRVSPAKGPTPGPLSSDPVQEELPRSSLPSQNPGSSN